VAECGHEWWIRENLAHALFVKGDGWQANGEDVLMTKAPAQGFPEREWKRFPRRRPFEFPCPVDSSSRHLNSSGQASASALATQGRHSSIRLI
jgi:hypothetical protein